MPKTEDCVLIHFVEEQPVGFQFPRHRNDWPLHITLASWFTAGSIEALAETLDQQASRFEPFKARVGQLAMFGPRQNVPVNIIVNPQPVRELRDALVTSVHETGGSFDSSRWFDSYRPHITQHDGMASNEGDLIVVDDFHMVRLLSGNICEVATQFLLRGDHEAAA